MKFIVDAHLPPGLCVILSDAGHDAVYTSRLTTRNRTPDPFINDLSIQEQRVVITKDSDFFYTHLVRTGNIRARDLKELFHTHLDKIVDGFDKNSLVVIDRKTVKIVL